MLCMCPALHVDTLGQVPSRLQVTRTCRHSLLGARTLGRKRGSLSLSRHDPAEMVPWSVQTRE